MKTRKNEDTINILLYRRRFALVVMAVFGALTTFAWAAPATQFTNIGSIANTRHNMAQSTSADTMVPKPDKPEPKKLKSA